MEIVGRGFLARHLAVLQDRHPDTTVLAAGVSSTVNTDPADHTREADLVYEVIARCKREGRRLVFLSTASASMYGRDGSDEDGPVYPRSPFGRHKLALETVLARSGVDYLALRLSHAVGAHQRPHQLVPALVSQIRSGRITVFRGATRDLIDVADVVRIIDGLLTERAAPGVFNVASGFSVPVEDLVAHLENRLGVTAEKTIVDHPGHHEVSTAKLRAAVPATADLGFGPRYYEGVVDRYLQAAGVAGPPPLTTRPTHQEDPVPTAAELYLDLAKRVLLNQIYQDRDLFRVMPEDGSPYRGRDVLRYDEESRLTGHGWPEQAHTMIGVKRLDNIQECVETVLADGVPGDLMETGVWRGGACIFMRAVLAAHGDPDRKVWVADSFEGLPVPDEENYPADKGWNLCKRNDVLGVSLAQVRENFRRYGLLDDRVEFLRGWFKDSLPNAPVEKLAYLRLDGDLYESTMDALVNLYPKVSPGGFVVIDDYALEPCAQAVDDYRAKFDVEDPIIEIDWSGVYWRKSA